MRPRSELGVGVQEGYGRAVELLQNLPHFPYLPDLLLTLERNFKAPALSSLAALALKALSQPSQGGCNLGSLRVPPGPYFALARAGAPHRARRKARRRTGRRRCQKQQQGLHDVPTAHQTPYQNSEANGF